MRLPQTLRTSILRQRWLVAAEQFQLHLALANPAATSSERRTLALRLKARCDLLVRVCAELRHLKANFNPAQARIPNGQPGAGQWTSGAGGSLGERPADGLAQDDLSFLAGGDPQAPSYSSIGVDDTPSSSIIGFAPDGTPILATGQDDNFPRRPSGFPVQLEDEEGDQGAHTMRDHVGKSDEQLLRTVQQSEVYKAPNGIYFKNAEGSFTTLRAANRLVSSTLSEPENASNIASAASGKTREYVDVESNTPFASPTGKEAFRASPNQQPYIRPTYAIRVVIVHDPTLTRGYRIVTAYPINKGR